VVARGNVPGVSFFHAFGFNPDIDTGGFEHIWGFGGDYTGFDATAAETLEVFSSDANDTSAGTGAQTVLIVGLDSNYNTITETVSMNGVTGVNTTQSFIRVNDFLVRTAGSTGINEGNITLRQSTTTANVMSYILADFGKALSAVYTVPADKKAYFTFLFGSIANKTNGNAALRAHSTEFGMARNIIGQADVHADGSSFAELRYEIFSGPIPEKTDLAICAESSLNNMGISAGFEIILEDT
jgi:hypothetical protein